MLFVPACFIFLLSNPAVTVDAVGDGGGLRNKKPCPMAKQDGVPLPDYHPPLSKQEQRRLQTDDGLLNEGKGCWGWCDETAGDCPQYCGTGQCCRDADYRNGVPGCELAQGVVGARCGLFAGELEPLRNIGLACSGRCDNTYGPCDYCGPEGSCCRLADGNNCVPGCELAVARWMVDGAGSQCGDFSGTAADCAGGGPPPPSPTNAGVDTPTPSPVAATGLLNEGESCGGPCGIIDGAEPGNCTFCGTGQCCNSNNWWRGKPGCELAENVTGNAICGLFDQPRQEPADFRIGEPLGGYYTPVSDVDTPPDSEGQWIKDIVADGTNPEDHALPAYSGDGGQPWSKFEIALVRDLLTFQMRQATAGRDELSTAKFIRLPFHDCLLYNDGTGGCDGCLNWDHVGFRFEGRVEDRNFEDHERVQSNNGLGFAVEFLETVYQMDLGKSWASGCYIKPGTVVGDDVFNTRAEPISVSTVDECRDICLNTVDCRYFTVPDQRFVDGNGPCRLFNSTAAMRELSTSTGRLIAGDAYCPHESWSLQSLGKSRADLWALASIVAIEEGIARHNYACDGDRRSPHNGPIMCTQFEGEEGCKITLPRPFAFQTGRKDCNPSSFTTEKKEALADEHFNGTMTVRFMEDHYGFTGKETVSHDVKLPFPS